MKIKHVVFDWDGSLVNTYPVLSAAYVHAFNSLNMNPLPYEEIKKITSTVPNKDVLECLFGSKKDNARSFFYDYIDKHHATKLEAMPNAQKLLDFCAQNDIKCYIVTNKKRKYFLEESNKLNFTKYFTSVVTAGDFAEDKPHPVATHAVFGYEIPDSETILIVGDGMADYKTARTYDRHNKKTKCIIYDPSNKYNGPKPDYTISDLSNVIDILKENK